MKSLRVIAFLVPFALAPVAAAQCDLTRLNAGDAEAFDEFGRAVALDRGTLLVGAPFEDESGSESGAVYVFEGTLGTWQQTEEIAAAYPNVYFDCCEIIEWTAGDKAPSDAELARLIQDVGPHRVMMGSDFPWYDLDHSIDRVMELPLLSNEEKTGIVGSNAVTILGL